MVTKYIEMMIVFVNIYIMILQMDSKQSKVANQINSLSINYSFINAFEFFFVNILSIGTLKFFILRKSTIKYFNIIFQRLFLHIVLKLYTLVLRLYAQVLIFQFSHYFCLNSDFPFLISNCLLFVVHIIVYLSDVLLWEGGTDGKYSLIIHTLYFLCILFMTML